MLIALLLLMSIDQPAPASSAGTATVKLTGADVNVSGEFPTTLCGGAYMMGKGMSYQVTAGDYRITIASETRSSGDVPLNAANGRINVVATVNGKGKNLVRGPRDGGTLKVASDYKKAEASLQLRPILGKEPATLVVTFVCK